MSVRAEAPEPFAQIVHLDLESQPKVPPPPSRGARRLYVYWSGDRPVGQRWSGPEGLISPAAPRCAEDMQPRTCDSARTSVTVIICTRDRPEQLARCLDGLHRQNQPADEVIVVDNASVGDATKHVVAAAGARYIREDRPGLDIARNTGMAAATSELVAFTDDDTELHPAWLGRLTSAFDADQVMAVTGLVLPARLDTPAQWTFERRLGFGRGYSRRDFGPDYYLATRRTGCPTWEIGAGANMAFRRSAVHEIGPFDERLGVGAAGCSDDSEYWYRILAAGWTCRYEPSAVVFHHHRATVEALAEQVRAYMKGHVAALLVQFERSGDYGNLRRIFVTLPLYFLRRAFRVVIRPPDQTELPLGPEVAGALAGIGFYLAQSCRTEWKRRRGPIASADAEKGRA